MMPHQAVLDYVKAEPFRPFRIRMTSGRTFDIRHPEMAKVTKHCVLVFKTDDAATEVPSEWEMVSLTLAESVSLIDVLAK